MKKTAKKLVVTGLVVSSLMVGATVGASSEKAELMKANAVKFFGSSTSSISSSVAIPHNYHTLYFSGTVPSVINRNGETLYDRYGDTETQAISILEKFKADLEGKGLSMSDITYLRVYVVPDPALDGKIDYDGWFKAYAKYFNTDENPVKTARSTVGVEGLVNSDWLIEIEAEVAYTGGK
ncbi:RidA family protein [Halalkalibacter alkalisediminis]|uniref:RidA family protein n=1 Tax=Halalkalibacter alkalisediminis TaxID=935616 RepID=A0ABV6NJP3_9BACI|nr:RidA family protein [Halalkalibacter alkalisediminis]